MKYYIRLIRPVNLIVIVLSFYVFRYTVFDVILSNYYYEFPISNFLFFILTISTVLIAAAGNIINDIKDVEIDRANKKTRRVVKHKINLKKAYYFYFTNLSLGLVLAIFFSISVGAWYLSFIHIISAVILHFYSPFLKCTKILGNVIIALFTSLIPLIILFYFYAADSDFTFEAKLLVFKIPFIVVGYSIFAFFINLLREISKDIEDRKGDKICGCKTVAVVWEIKKIKILMIALLFAAIISLVFMSIVLMNSKMVVFGTGLLLVPTILLVDVFPRIVKAKDIKSFKVLSKYFKIILAFGLALLFLVHFS